MRLARLAGGPRAAVAPVLRQYVSGRPEKGSRAGTAARRSLTATRFWTMYRDSTGRRPVPGGRTPPTDDVPEQRGVLKDEPVALRRGARLERRGEAMTVDAISIQIRDESCGSRNGVETHVARLRAKLRQAGAAGVVKNIRGVSYVIRSRAGAPPQALTSTTGDGARQHRGDGVACAGIPRRRGMGDRNSRAVRRPTDRAQ